VSVYLLRASREFPLNLGYALEYLRDVSPNIDSLESVYQELNNRFFQSAKPSLYKIWVLYFRFTLFHIIHQKD